LKPLSDPELLETAASPESPPGLLSGQGGTDGLCACGGGGGGGRGRSAVCTPLGPVSFLNSSLGSPKALAASLSLVAARREFTSLTKEGAVLTSSGLPCQGWDDFQGPGASPSGRCVERMWGGMRSHGRDLTPGRSRGEWGVESVVRRTFCMNRSRRRGPWTVCLSCLGERAARFVSPLCSPDGAVGLKEVSVPRSSRGLFGFRGRRPARPSERLFFF
jgi:hypothetical protein